MRARSVFVHLSIAILLAVALQAKAVRSPKGGCFSIVVGKDASVTGSVLLAHNEDDFIPQIVNHHKVPHRSHAEGATVQLSDRNSIDQAPQTLGYIWSEIPDLYFSDSYLNERGVCICSDACKSREDFPDLTNDGITFMLRRIVAERAGTAREGVHLAGQLIEQFGYTSSGRTYSICDPREGWVLCAVEGRRWVAQRVPDDQVAIVANTYTIQTIDLSDTMNYLSSTDIIDYAVKRGWYHPDTDGPFNFANAYSDSSVAADSSNICRRWDGVRLIVGGSPDLRNNLPFSMKPSKKIGLRDIMTALRSHFENTPLYAVDSASGDPHRNSVSPICSHETQTSFIAELRDNLPTDIGLVYWVALSSPCASCYIPFYYGTDPFPQFYSGECHSPANTLYESFVNQPFSINDSSAFWQFTSLRHHTEQQYRKMSHDIRRTLDAVELDALSKQADLEQKAINLLATDRRKALDLLSGFSLDTYRAAQSALATIRFTD
jgi:dipeptidase